MDAVIAAKLSAVPATGERVSSGWEAMQDASMGQFPTVHPCSVKLPTPMFRCSFGLILGCFTTFATVNHVAGYPSDVETALNQLASGSVAQYPCVKLMTAANGDIGCSSTCMFSSAVLALAYKHGVFLDYCRVPTHAQPGKVA
jgi:hypothetical protein